MPHHCHHAATPRPRIVPEAEALLVNQLLASMERPEAPIDEVVPGSHFIGMRAGNRAGLASVLGAKPSPEELRLAEELPGKPLAEAAALLLDESPFLVSLGAAALNTGLGVPNGCAGGQGAAELLAEQGRDAEVVLVGEFPFTPWLREQVGALHLFDLSMGEGVVPRDQWEEVLARSTVVGLTGTTLLTRSMAWYLERARHAFTVIIGPTTPMSPALFERGADVLAGSRVAKPGPVFEGLRQGQSFRQFKKLGVEFLNLRRPNQPSAR